jgi:hypothetical protein
MTDPCYPNFGDDYSFIFNNANYFEDFIVGYRQEAGCTNHSSIRHFLVWMRGRKTFHTAAGIPLYNLENSGEMTYKNSSGTITMTLSTQGDIMHPGNMRTKGNTTIDGNTQIDGNTLMKGKLNVRDVTTFEIPNPAATGTFLNHGALQSREHALYVRGQGSGVAIALPANWTQLVEISSITVHLTPSSYVPVSNPEIEPFLHIPIVTGVSNIGGTYTVSIYNPYNVSFHYLVIGTRKDVPNA